MSPKKLGFKVQAMPVYIFRAGGTGCRGGGVFAPPLFGRNTLNISPQKTFYSCLYPQFFSPFAGTDINQASMSCRPVPKFSLLLWTVFSYVWHTELTKTSYFLYSQYFFKLIPSNYKQELTFMF